MVKMMLIDVARWTILLRWLVTMEQWLEHVMANVPWTVLVFLIAFMLYTLAKGADMVADDPKSDVDGLLRVQG